MDVNKVASATAKRTLIAWTKRKLIV